MATPAGRPAHPTACSQSRSANSPLRVWAGRLQPAPRAVRLRVSLSPAGSPAPAGPAAVERRTSSVEARNRSPKPGRPGRASAVSREARVAERLEHDLRRHHEHETVPQPLHNAGSFPGRLEAVEIVPDTLSPLSDLLARHRRVRCQQLRPLRLRNQPVARHRDAVNRRHIVAKFTLPPFKVQRPRERRQCHELPRR